MEGSNQRTLRQNIFKMFMNRPHSITDSRNFHKNLVHGNGTVENLFKARYDDIFLENISNKQGIQFDKVVFSKVLANLENMVKVKKELKGNAKNRKSLLFED